jgi:type II secretory ATPase GspE/PulE/Tfp pilus assembly ATPase PilB-like protein
MLARPDGFFLFSAVPGQGLSTTVLYAQKAMDRYLRDFISFQQQGADEPVAENVELVTYDPASDDAEQKMVSMFRREPNVVLVHQLTSGKMVELICEQAQRKKLILATIPAKEAVEALLRVLLLKVPAKVFAPVVYGVLNQRLIRRLCESCKQPYTPSPQLLKKLGIPTGRVDQLFRPPNPGEEEAICEKCGGIGYYGRIALYELLTVDSGIRQTLVEQPKLEALRKAARTAGHRTLQDEGIALVARGTTSLAELQRVLKQ